MPLKELYTPSIFPALSATIVSPQNRVNSEMRKWIKQQQWLEWDQLKGCRQARTFMEGPGSHNRNQVISLKRNELRKICSLLTGHGSFNKHLVVLRVTTDSKCRYCGALEEDAEHILCMCPALFGARLMAFGNEYPAGFQVRMAKLSELKAFVRHLADI